MEYKPVIRDESGRVVKGSGPINPNGRPKGLEKSLRERYGDNLETILDKLNLLLENTKNEKLIKEICDSILDRVYGKPVQHQTVESDMNITVGKPKMEGEKDEESQD